MWTNIRVTAGQSLLFRFTIIREKIILIIPAIEAVLIAIMGSRAVGGFARLELALA